MPVVTVTAPGEPAASLGRDVADAVAAALGLGPGDVLVSVIPAHPTVASGAVRAGPWPVALIFGSDRGAKASATAVRAAEQAVRGAYRDPLGGVWAQWVAAPGSGTIPHPAP